MGGAGCGWVAVSDSFLCRWDRILSMAFSSSIQAITLTALAQRAQTSTSVLKTRLRRCAHVIDAWHSASALTSVFAPVFSALPRLAGVTSPRQRWFGARTPWNRLRLTLGFGTRAANRAMKSTGSKATCVVPSRWGVYRVYTTLPLELSDRRGVATAGRAMYRQSRSRLPF